jgi:hypothetical protein
MQLRATPVVLAAALGISLLAGTSFARPPYRQQVIVQYKLAPDRTDGTRNIGCTYCHRNSSGAQPWNPFGDNVRGEYVKIDPLKDPSKRNDVIKQSLVEVLKRKIDSDGDDWYDAIEVFAGTLPGNKDSKPPEGAFAKLQADFEKAGGIKSFEVK